MPTSSGSGSRACPRSEVFADAKCSDGRGVASYSLMQYTVSPLRSTIRFPAVADA